MTITINYQRSTVYNTDDIRAIADHAGSPFFSPGAMRRFRSRTLDGVVALDGHDAVPGARFMFVTSEVFGDDPRHYTVRMATLGAVRDGRPSVDICSVGDYYGTAREARAALDFECGSPDLETLIDWSNN